MLLSIIRLFSIMIFQAVHHQRLEVPTSSRHYTQPGNGGNQLHSYSPDSDPALCQAIQPQENAGLAAVPLDLGM